MHRRYNVEFAAPSEASLHRAIHDEAVPQVSMDLVKQFIEAAKGLGQTVVLPEGADSRVVAAARRLVDEQISEPIILGTPAEIEQAARQAAVSISGVRAVDPAAS